MNYIRLDNCEFDDSHGEYYIVRDIHIGAGYSYYSLYDKEQIWKENSEKRLFHKISTPLSCSIFSTKETVANFIKLVNIPIDDIEILQIKEILEPCAYVFIYKQNLITGKAWSDDSGYYTMDSILTKLNPRIYDNNNDDIMGQMYLFSMETSYHNYLKKVDELKIDLINILQDKIIKVMQQNTNIL